MILKKWEDLPVEIKNSQVKIYYEILQKKRFSLVMKRLFDIVVSAVMLFLLSPIFLVLAVAIKIDSKGSVFYRQERITRYGKTFKIHKFRTMIQNADKLGSLVTINNDSRITRVGKFIREYRLDELPQLIDVFQGNMSFVGMRPEIQKYVDEYSDEMMATLLLPAGVTSEACIRFKDEAKLLDESVDVDRTYIREVLPCKMYYGLKSIKEYGFFYEIGTMTRTVLAVLGKKYENDVELEHIVEQSKREEMV